MSYYTQPTVASKIIETTFGRLKSPREVRQLAMDQYNAELSHDEIREVLRCNHKLYPRVSESVGNKKRRAICLEGNKLR